MTLYARAIRRGLVIFVSLGIPVPQQQSDEFRVLFYAMKTFSKLVLFIAIINIGFIVAYIIRENSNSFLIFLVINLIVQIIAYVVIIQIQHRRNYKRINDDLLGAGQIIRKSESPDKETILTVLYLIRANIMEFIYPKDYSDDRK